MTLLDAQEVRDSLDLSSVDVHHDSILQQAFEGFRWKGEFSSQDRVFEQLSEFFKDVGVMLKLSVGFVHNSINTAVGMAEDWYVSVFPKKEMKYHDIEHATATAAVGMKIFLGLLESLRYKNNGEGMYGDPKAMEKTVQLASLVFAMHEKDDWWKGNSPERYAELSIDLNKKITDLGLKVSDFEKLIKLDDFVVDLPDLLKQLENNELDGFLEFIPKDQRLEIAEAMGIALNAADFAQICNEAYSEKAIVIAPNGEKIVAFRGQLALAREFELFRPQALKGAHWEREDDPAKADVTKIRWERYFYDEKAFPRIMRGLQALWLFDPAEARGLLDRLQELEDQFV